MQGTPRQTARTKDRDLRRFLLFFVGDVRGDPRLCQPHGGHAVGVHWAAVAVRQHQPGARHPGDLRPLARRAPVTARWRPLRWGQGGGHRLAELARLTPRQVRRLQMACEQHLAACVRGDQVPLLEAAVFYVLLHTGLREHVLVRLDVDDYHHRAFHQVKRKGSRVSRRVPVPADARLHLERYLAESRGKLLAKSGGLAEGQGPLLASRRGGKLTTRAVAYICSRLARYACASLPEAERFHFAPHQLRHAFLERVADEHRLHHAQKLSSNVSMPGIFRYTKPSDDEVVATAEGLFIWTMTGRRP